MRLNREGKLAKFYMWLPPDDKKLPQDLCTYFWGLVGRAFAIFIIGGSMAVTIICGAVIGILWLSRLIWAHKALTLWVVSSGLIFALTIWLSGRKKKIKIQILSETRAIIKGKIEAVKGRYCPRIECDSHNQSN